MTNKTITVETYINHFGLTVLCGYEEISSRTISEMATNRPGFELCGVFKSSERHRLVILGNREIEYINDHDEKRLRKVYEFLTSEECPGIVICSSLECPKALLEIARKNHCPVLSTGMRTSDLIVQTFTYLQEALAPTTNLPASLLEIYSMGVLILGESGIGKSETTLELIKKGHKLIADDRVDITLIRGKLIGRAPDLLTGVMEVRGIGIIDIAKLFGINSLSKEERIMYAIKLTPFKKENVYDRLGNSVQYLNILGVNVPLLNLPVSGARSMAEIIEVAVTNLKLKDQGIDSTFEFENRMNELLLKKKG